MNAMYPAVFLPIDSLGYEVFKNTSHLVFRARKCGKVSKSLKIKDLSDALK